MSVSAVFDIRYGDHKKQALDIFMPLDQGKFPVLFFVHGGCWSEGERHEYSSLGYFYAKNGYVTVIADYRLSPEVVHPAHLQDVLSAFSWVQENIGTYKGNKDKIAGLGHSAGAHLLSLATAKHAIYLQSVIVVSGIYNLGINLHLAGLSHIFEDKEEASPINFIKVCMPPFLVMYAQNDIFTFAGQSKNFSQALTKKSNRSQIYCAKGLDHYSILKACAAEGKTSEKIMEFISWMKK